ncbi:MAG: pilus assembly protein PilM [Parcubacteria group bacterium]|nr:pilus assembly protein PilM [Parcubacteria group bacterium]
MPLLTDTFDAFGLDIGDRSLKAAYLTGRRSAAALKSIGAIDVPNGVFDAGALKAPDALREHVQKLLAVSGPKKIKTKYVHACLPETHTFLKLLTFEGVGPEELPAAIREELPRHVPLSPEELYLDWAVVAPELPATSTRVLVGAIPKETSDSYTAALRRCGLVPVSLQIEAQAMLRALLPDDPEADSPFAVVDIGATRSSFVLYDRGSIQFTVTIPVSGVAATERIANGLHLAPEEAENAKQAMGLDPQKGGGSVRAILLPLINELSGAIQKNAAFYQEHFPESRGVATVLLCGGGSLLPGLFEELQLSLPGASISHGNPGAHVESGAKLGITLPYTTAIGLALSNMR